MDLAMMVRMSRYKLKAVFTLLAGLAFAAPLFAADQPLVIEKIEITGNSRTSESTVYRWLRLEPGDEVTPEELLAAMETFRETRLFDRVEFTSRPGSARGRIVLHIEAREKGAQFRFGAGYQDLSGWYVIPAELRFDNRLGLGEQIRLQLKIGYRTTGLHLLYEHPRFGDGRNHWGFSLYGTGNDRLYFLEGTEYRHNVEEGGAEAHLGRRLTEHLSLELGGGYENVDPDSFAVAGGKNDDREIAGGDELPFGELPADVAAGIDLVQRGVARFDLTWDSRAAGRLAGTPVAGLWGRVRAKGIFPDAGDPYPIVTADLRGYRALFGAAFTAWIRAGAATAVTPWYDRFYIGGLYTVRGFPSHSLSRPGGETRFCSVSIEMRSPLAGGRTNPRLAGILFVEAADGWSVDSVPKWEDVAASAGYGLRLRVPWLGWLGVDAGIPLTESPVKDAFNLNGSIGMTF